MLLHKTSQSIVDRLSLGSGLLATYLPTINASHLTPSLWLPINTRRKPISPTFKVSECNSQSRNPGLMCARLVATALSASVLLLLAAVDTAHAIKPVYAKNRDRIAIRGYDAVAYFTKKSPIKGNVEFSVEYDGANWLFASLSNKAKFAANPSKYAPQYGGYCAYAVAKNAVASSKPEYFVIVEDKLYLNCSEAAQQKWFEMQNEHIRKANENWPRLLER